MSPSELQVLKDERKFTEGMLRETAQEKYGAGSAGSQMDKEALSRQAKHYAKQEEMYAPRALRGANKDKVAKECKRLEAEFKQGMPTCREMEKSGTAYKQLAWEKRNAQNLQAWKQLQRRLEPGNPMASNVERLRRSR